MALRKLAGPFDIKDGNGATPALSVGSAAWVPYMGLALRAFSGTGIGMLALDGLIQPFANNWYGGFWGWDAINNALLSVSTNGGGNVEYVLDPRSFIGYVVDPTGGLGVATQYIKLLDRRLIADGNVVVSVAADGTHSTEFTGTGLPNAPSISAGRSAEDHFIVDNSVHSGFLRCRFYNSASKSVSPMMYVPALTGGSNWLVRYSPELKLIVAVDLDNASLSIWSLEVLPDSISDPAVTSGSISKGNIAVVTSQLLGANGDPCEGELVDWSLTGSAELLDEQSMTDVDGHASARVFCSFSDSGDIAVTASVRC